MVLLSGLAWPAGGDIQETVHNLLSNTAAPVPDEAREICAFCHFPEGGSAQDPSWVRNGNGDKPVFSTFPTLGISTPMSEQVNAVGSVSLACLSCHDGTHARNIPIGHRAGISHPIAVPYAFGRYRRIAGVPSTEVQLNRNVIDDDYPMPEVDFVNQSAVWWVETDGEIGRQKSDLQLYSRIEGNTEIPYVECSTCHDPHGKQALFLRTSNSGSRVCLTCHLR